MRRRYPAFLLLLLLLLAGCIRVGVGSDEPAPPVVFHILDGPAVVDLGKPLTQRVIAVRPFQTQRSFENRVTVLREPGIAEFLDFDRWGEDPDQAVTIEVRELLARSRVFGTVVDASADLAADLTLDGFLLRFFIDARKQPHHARLEFRLIVARRTTGAVIHSGVFEGSAALPADDAKGLGPAMRQALDAALANAVDTWRKAGVQ